MATVRNERNLLLILSKNFLFFEWKFEECDMKIGSAIQSSKFGTGELQSSFLEMEVDEEIGNVHLYLYCPRFVSGGYYVISIYDSDKSAIFNKMNSTETFSGNWTVDLLTNFRKIPASSKFPITVLCTAKSLNANISDSFVSLDRLSELSTDMKKILDQSINHDIVLNVDGEKIKSHKAILKARSPVFNKMFDHDSREVADNNVVITDVGVAPMKKFLSFLYTGTVEKCEFDEAFQLYYIADKYEVLTLRKDCKMELLKLINVDNACSLFTLANRHNDESFLEEIITFICANFKSVVSTDSLGDLSKEDMMLLMRKSACILKSESGKK